MCKSTKVAKALRDYKSNFQHENCHRPRHVATTCPRSSQNPSLWGTSITQVGTDTYRTDIIPSVGLRAALLLCEALYESRALWDHRRWDLLPKGDTVSGGPRSLQNSPNFTDFLSHNYNNLFPTYFEVEAQS